MLINLLTNNLLKMFKLILIVVLCIALTDGQETTPANEMSDQG